MTSGGSARRAAGVPGSGPRGAATTTPHGAWTSPITAAMAAAGMAAGVIASPAYVAAAGAEVWWVEPRPEQNGRTALVRRRPDGTVEQPLPERWNVRNRVLEYGGRPFAVAEAGDGVLVVFAHFDDQRLYAWRTDRPGDEPQALTPVSAVGGGLRWAEPEIDLERGEVRCVLEEFTGEDPSDLRRIIAAVPLDGSAAGDRAAVRELHGGRNRFLSGLRVSPDGALAVWLAWDHPHMPWEAAELRIADVGPDGRLHRARTLTGGPDAPVAQAEWAADGGIVAACEGTGWWNLYRVDPRTGAKTPLHPAEEEFAGAQRLGFRWFAPLADGRIAVLHGVGNLTLGLLDPGTGRLTRVPGEKTEWLPHLAVCGDSVIGIAAGPATPFEVLATDTRDLGTRLLSPAPADPPDPRYLPVPEPRVFTGPDGRAVHALLYPPRNPDHTAPPGEPAPYAVWVHGGPTARAPLALNLEIAWFTSRGIGVADVNYSGSPGYGRAYRDRLNERWGLADVEDCATVARALADEGLTAPGLLAIRGGSAGGFTSAASLATTDVYACGTLFCPLLNLEDYASGDSHDYESHSLESLIGPLRQVPERYRERSPVQHADRITAPFLLLQGLDDVICTPAQSRQLVDRMAGRSVPYAYLTFEGEGHGFRRADTMITCLEAELSLYGQVFGFTPPGVPRLYLTG